MGGGGSPIVRTNLARYFRIGLSGSEQILCPAAHMLSLHPNFYNASVGAGP